MKPICFLTLFALLFLSACTSGSADPLAYQYEALSLTLQGQMDGVDFSAELVLSPCDSDAGEALDRRAFVLTYTAPSTLKGLTLTRGEGGMTLSRGTVTLPVGENFAGLAAPAELFCIDSVLGSAEVIRQNGTTLNRLSVTDDEGSYVLWLDVRGFPRRIEAVLRGRQIWVDLPGAKTENTIEEGTTFHS